MDNGRSIDADDIMHKLNVLERKMDFIYTAATKFKGGQSGIFSVATKGDEQTKSIKRNVDAEKEM